MWWHDPILIMSPGGGGGGGDGGGGGGDVDFLFKPSLRLNRMSNGWVLKTMHKRVIQVIIVFIDDNWIWRLCTKIEFGNCNQ